jgi:uncharacterized alpha-E superfamily protein
MLLSRLAEGTFWFARHLERAEDLSRAILVCEQLRLDMPGDEPAGWQRLASVAGIDPEAAAVADPGALVGRVLADRDNPSSVFGALHRARENLRRTRSLLPSECWHTLNLLFLRVESLDGNAPPAELAAVLAQVVASSQQLAGQITARMLRDQGYTFLRMGHYLERADMMMRIARTVAASLIPTDHAFRFEDVRWTGLLKSVGAYQAYRRRHHARADLGSVLELLFVDEAFPRSVAHAVQQIGRELEGLPGHQASLAALRSCSPGKVPATRAAFDGAAGDALERLGRLAEAIQTTYFSSGPEAAVTAGARGQRREMLAQPDVAQT